MHGRIRRESTSSPNGKSVELVRAVRNSGQEILHDFCTSFVVSSTDLSNDCLSVSLGERLLDFLHHIKSVLFAFRVLSRTISVKVSVQVKHEILICPVWILDVLQVLQPIWEVTHSSVVITRKKNNVRLCTCFSDAIDDLLDSFTPFVHVQCVRLVDNAKDDFRAVGVLGRNLAPQINKIVIGNFTLTDNLSVVTSIVVDVDDGFAAVLEDFLDELVVLAEKVRIKRTIDRLLHELPTKRESDERCALFDEMGDLFDWRDYESSDLVPIIDT